jgi:hypothetical protein
MIECHNGRPIPMDSCLTLPGRAAFHSELDEILKGVCIIHAYSIYYAFSIIVFLIDRFRWANSNVVWDTLFEKPEFGDPQIRWSLRFLYPTKECRNEADAR